MDNSDFGQVFARRGLVGRFSAWAATLVCLIPGALVFAGDEPVPSRDAPDWCRDARWVALQDIPQDLHAAVPRFVDAGFNGVVLPDLFTADGRHVKDGFPIPDSADVKGESGEDEMGRAADAAFLSWLRQAHDSGLRVVIALDELRAQAIEPLAAHWLDPNGDGDFADGVDGYLLPEVSLPPSGVQKLARLMRAENRDAVLLGRADGNGDNDVRRLLDVVEVGSIQQSLAAFVGDGASRSLDKLAKALNKSFDGDPGGARVARWGWLSGADGSRLIARAHESSSGRKDADTETSPEARSARALDDYRLALMVFHFLPVSPVTAPADLVWGEPVAQSEDSLVARIWSAAGAHGLMELVRIQNLLRDRFGAVRRGGFGVVAVNEKDGLLILERKTEASRVIMVMNWSGERVRAGVAIGRPRHVVGVLTPQIRPGKSAIPFRISSTRQLTDDEGVADLPVGPRSARFIVVDEERIRR